MRPGRIERDGAPPIPQVWAADRWWSRLRGLLARPTLAGDGSQALLITPCASVHTFGMRYPLDLVYLDFAGKVVGWREHVAPWRFSACRRAVSRAATGPLAAACARWKTVAMAAAQPRSPASSGCWLTSSSRSRNRCAQQYWCRRSSPV